MLQNNVKKLHVVQTINEMRRVMEENRKAGRSSGFVPTMGYLHEGHLSLVKKANEENDLTVMSIFVNPAQFGANEDLDSYPRNAERDIRLAEEAGVDYLFMPDSLEMYPSDSGISIIPGRMASVLCGASRPGHFDGVLKVVLKLFNIIDPDRSYFGKKDAQQLAIIESFVKDFNLRTEIIRAATVRETDGLAKSSRNVYLSDRERAEAPILFEALKTGASLYKAGGEPAAVEAAVRKHIQSSASAKVDYIRMLSYPALSESFAEGEEVILAAAIVFSKARLIDNIIM